MTSKENYNEPIYENLNFFKGLELVYRHPCLHLRIENKECGNCKYGLNNNCVIHNEYLKIKKDLEVLEILKKYLKVKSLELGIEDIVICCENEKDFNEIKEWLENEKSNS